MNTSDPDTPAPSADETPWRPADTLWLLFALIVTGAVFWRSLSGELVYDDLLLVGRNPLLSDLANLPVLFRSPYWDFLDPGASEQIGYWRPLSAVVHALAWAAGEGTPRAFHAACLSVHLAATGAAFLLVRRLVHGFGTERAWIAGASALLFGLHPLHVESVAWISALNDPLFGLFALLSLYAFLGWRQRGSRGLPLLACVWFLLSLLSKEMGACVVPLCLAIDLGRGRQPGEPLIFRRDLWVRGYAPFLVLTGLYVVARMFVFGSLYAGFDRTPTHFNVGAGRLLLLRSELLGGSLALLAWPQELNAFRPFRPTLSWLAPDVVAGLIATAVSIGLGVLLALRKRWLELSALLVVPLALTPIFVNVGSLGRFPLSDRFLYLPVLGFVLLLALAARRYLPQRGAQALLLLVAALYGTKSWNRIGVWHDELSLFQTAVTDSPRSAYLHWGLGRVYLQRASESKDPDDLAVALRIFEHAGDLLTQAKQPDTDLFVTSNDYLQVNLGLAQCYLLEASIDDYGGYGTAITILEDLARRIGELRDRSREAREAGMRVVDPNHRLDLVYAALGNAHRLAGDREAAREAYRRALSLNDRCVEALMGMGRLFAESGDWTPAIRNLEKAVELQPGEYESRLALAQALREFGRTAEAEELALELVEQDPSVAEALLIVATNRLEERNARDALAWIDRALKADPEHGHAWYLKGMAMQSLEVNQQATLEALRRATQLMPDSFPAQFNYGILLVQSGAVDAALPYLARAYGLTQDPVMVGRLFTMLMQLPIDSAPILYQLAAADGKRGRNDVAESWLDRALEQDPDHPDSLLQKARLLSEQGREDEAQALFARAAELLPEVFAVRLEFGRFLESRGRLAEAERELQACLDMPRPEGWDETTWGTAQAQLRGMLARIAGELPPTDAIGPTAPGASDG